MKRKGKNPILVYPGLRYTQKINLCMQNFFFKKCLFEYENQFAVKKNKKILGTISKKKLKCFCRCHQKKLVIHFPYTEIV